MDCTVVVEKIHKFHIIQIVFFIIIIKYDITKHATNNALNYLKIFSIWEIAGSER